MSAMLLGTVSFMMLLFYTMNFPDEDIRFYSCKTTGDAISIFVAILLYEAVRKCVHNLMPTGTVAWSLAVDALQFVLWFLVLQVGGAFLARVGDTAPSADASSSLRGRMEHTMRWRELQLRSATFILAHVTGFAAICVSSGLQQQVALHGGSTWQMLLLLPAVGLPMWACFAVSGHVRRRIIEMDGVTTVNEQLWNTASAAAAEEAWGLAMSFQCITTWLFCMAGKLADRHGSVTSAMAGEEWRAVSGLLLATATVSFVAMLGLAALSKQVNEQASEFCKGAFTGFSDLICMSFAWSFLFTARAAVCYLLPQFAFDGITSRILVALGLSVFAFIWVLLLDRCADSIVGSTHHQDTHKALVRAIMSVGILVGFAWELAFARASDTLDEETHSPANIVSVSVSLGLCLLVTPAYLSYICPVIDDSRRMVDPKVRRGSSRVFFKSMFSWSAEDYELSERLGLEVPEHPTRIQGGGGSSSSGQDVELPLPLHEDGDSPDARRHTSWQRDFTPTDLTPEQTPLWRSDGPN